MSKLTIQTLKIQSDHVLYVYSDTTSTTLLRTYALTKSKIRCVQLIMKLKMQNHHRIKMCGPIGKK